MAVLLSNLLEKSSNFRQLLTNFGATFWKFLEQLVSKAISYRLVHLQTKKKKNNNNNNKTKQNKNTPGSKPLLSCTEVNSIFHEVFKFKKARENKKKDFDQYC